MDSCGASSKRLLDSSRKSSSITVAITCGPQKPQFSTQKSKILSPEYAVSSEDDKRFSRTEKTMLMRTDCLWFLYTTR